MTNTTSTTCQICGREIKSKNGVIAHHGYTRPGDGWQTKSCMGARYLPYEISCDVLPGAIQAVENYLRRITEKLAEIISNPPAEISVKEKVYTGFGGKEFVTKTYSRPEKFNISKPTNYSYSSADYNYGYAFQRETYRLQAEIKSVASQLEFLKNRLANWKPAQET